MIKTGSGVGRVATASFGGVEACAAWGRIHPTNREIAILVNLPLFKTCKTCVELSTILPCLLLFREMVTREKMRKSLELLF